MLSEDKQKRLIETEGKISRIRDEIADLKTAFHSLLSFGDQIKFFWQGIGLGFVLNLLATTIHQMIFPNIPILNIFYLFAIAMITIGYIKYIFAYHYKKFVNDRGVILNKLEEKETTLAEVEKELKVLVNE